MANIVTVEANKLLDSSVEGLTYTEPSGVINLALITTTTPSTNTVAGSEVTGGSYARAATTSKWAAATGGSKTTTAAISFTGMPGPISVGGIELWDSTGTPIRRWFGTLTGGAKSVNSGDTVTFAIGSIVITLS